jgi:IS4 transposase
VFLTNQFALPAVSICALYKSRWQVELFFKWIKQHLRIKKFYGTSDNAVKTQIWIAVSIYVLVAIVKKRLALEAPLYTLLQVFSVTLRHPVRENADAAGTFGNGDHVRGRPDQQSIEFVRLLTGHQ